MNRLASLVMLVAFAVQQIACCCGEMTSNTYHPANARQTSVCTYEHSHSHGDHHHSHDPFDHDHDANYDGDETDHESCPGDRSHQHHVCIGTHFFFVSAPRAEMPKQDMGYGFHVARIDVLNQLAMVVRSAGGHHGVDYGPPLSSRPQRSALCVYRI